eukprot:COSAG01_NODE_107_length_25964_cov_174.577576_19_plen_206_part_00
MEAKLRRKLAAGEGHLRACTDPVKRSRIEANVAGIRSRLEHLLLLPGGEDQLVVPASTVSRGSEGGIARKHKRKCGVQEGGDDGCPRRHQRRRPGGQQALPLGDRAQADEQDEAGLPLEERVALGAACGVVTLPSGGPCVVADESIWMRCVQRLCESIRRCPSGASHRHTNGAYLLHSWLPRPSSRGMARTRGGRMGPALRVLCA